MHPRPATGSGRVELVFVLGVDPGLSRCGYAAVTDGPGGRMRAVALGVLTTPTDQAVPQRLAELRRDLAALIADLHPDVVAVEHVFFQTNRRTAMSVAQASGIALAEAAAAGCEVVQYTSNEVKHALCGYGAATKAQLASLVRVRLELSHPPRPADAADAAALAICHLTIAPYNARVKAAMNR